jgi:hypothetical protein
MSAAGTREWKCPECGKVVELSVTQLDPMACDACLAKHKSRTASSPTTALTQAVSGPLGLWTSLPEIVKLGAVVVGLVIGLLVGFIAGQAMAPVRSAGPAAGHPKEKDDVPVADEREERPPAPGPGYHWVRGRLRKDGTRGDGHWAKDPNYKSEPDGNSRK